MPEASVLRRRVVPDSLAILGSGAIIALASIWIGSTNANLVNYWHDPWRLRVLDGGFIAQRWPKIKPMPPRTPGEPMKVGDEEIPIPEPVGIQCLIPRVSSTNWTSSVFGDTRRIDTVIIPLWIPMVLLIAATGFPAWQLSQRTVHWLKSRRIRVGHCIRCNYNLTGNESNKCPECGTPTSNSEPAIPSQTPKA